MPEQTDTSELIDVQRDLEEMRSLNERRRRMDPRSAEYETAYRREMELSRRIRRWATDADATQKDRLRDVPR